MKLFLVFSLIYIVTSSKFIDDEFENSLDKIVNKVMQCHKFVGLSIGLVRDDEVFTKAYGLSDLEKNISMTVNTKTGIASLTKAFTTLLLADILSKANLTWDTVVKSVVKDFTLPTWEMTEKATFRDLASHKLGLKTDNYARLNLGFTRETVLDYSRILRPILGFRTSYKYNNIIYGILSRISEILSDETSWETLMKRVIFDPLEMKDSTFSHVADLDSPDIAKAYLLDLENQNKLRKVPQYMTKRYGALGGSGSILSTAVDMTKWLKYLLSPEKFPKAPKTDILMETFKPRTLTNQEKMMKHYKKPLSPVSYTYDRYGLGWRTGLYRGLDQIFHTGTSWGSGSYLQIVPSKKIGIFIGITNPERSGFRGRRALNLYLLDRLLNETEFLDATNICTFPITNEIKRTNRRRTRIDRISDSITKNLIGTYGNFLFGNITIATYDNETRLYMKNVESSKTEDKDEGYWLLHTNPKNMRKVGNSRVFTFDGFGRRNYWPIKITFKTSRDTTTNEKFNKISVDKFDADFVRDLKRDMTPGKKPCPCLKAASSFAWRIESRVRWVVFAISLFVWLN